MICPVCHSQVPDEASVCPACHTDLSLTRVMPRLRGSWCSSCGALIPEGQESCPKCGSPVAYKNKTVEPAQVRSAPSMAERLPNLEEAPAEQTRSMPRIESAIPAEPDPEVEAVWGKEHLPRTKTFIVAAVASLIIVGGGILLITHPWDPTLTDTRATTAADVSTAGYPGEVSRLTGQDSDTDKAISVLSADEETFSKLSAAYVELGELSERADELESELDEFGTTGSSDERTKANEDAQQLSLDISNLASSISNIETSTTGTYTEDRTHLATLASWLRNRIEAITSSWERSVSSTDADYILSPMSGNRTSDGSEAYVNLFEANYEDWEPQQK